MVLVLQSLAIAVLLGLIGMLFVLTVWRNPNLPFWWQVRQVFQHAREDRERRRKIRRMKKEGTW